MAESAKESILKEAKRLFAEQGFDATSIRELAESAGVNVAAINYHFGSKQGLFETLVKDFTQRQLGMVVSVLEPPETREEFRVRISMFMKHFLLLANNEHQCFRMLNRNMETFANMDPQGFQATFGEIHERFLKFAEQAQRSQIIQSHIDVEILCHILFGSLIELVRGEELRKAFQKKSITDSAFCELYIKTFVDGFLNGVGVKND